VRTSFYNGYRLFRILQSRTSSLQIPSHSLRQKRKKKPFSSGDAYHIRRQRPSSTSLSWLWTARERQAIQYFQEVKTWDGRDDCFRIDASLVYKPTYHEMKLIVGGSLDVLDETGKEYCARLRAMRITFPRGLRSHLRRMILVLRSLIDGGQGAALGTTADSAVYEVIIRKKSCTSEYNGYTTIDQNLSLQHCLKVQLRQILPCHLLLQF